MQAIWSINESYSRPSLAIVTVIVAVVTYAVTLNLNNLSRGLGKLLAPRRRALIEQMGQDPDWKGMGHRFKAFQRAEGGQRKPSEWVIGLFFMKGIVDGLWGVAKRVAARLKRGHDDDDGAGLPETAPTSGSVGAAGLATASHQGTSK